MRLPHLRLALGAGACLALTSAAVVAVAQTPSPAPRAQTEIVTKDGDRTVVIRRQGPDGRRMEFRHPHMMALGGPRGAMGPRHRSPEDHAEHLRMLLQLTPAQEAALKTYVAAVAPPDPGALRSMIRDDDTPPTAVERADRAAQIAGRMAAEAKARADATRAFYAQLTTSQRKVFDSMGAGPVRMRIRDFRGPPPMPAMPPAPPAPPAPPRSPS